VRWIGPDDSWTAAPELGALAKVFDQDMGNVARVQRGLHTIDRDLTLSHYQEGQIRRFHRLLEEYVYGSAK
jgi:hypothetical protein